MSDDDVYGEFREKYARAKKREHRSTLLATLLPVLIVIALVLVAGSRLMDANVKLQNANKELQTSNAELKQEKADVDAVAAKLTEKIETLEKEKTTLQETLDWVKKQNTRPHIQARINQTIEKTDTEAAPKIDLHIAAEDQRDDVRDLRTGYIKEGYVAPGIENVAKLGATIPKETEVRYFREEDKQEAAKIAAQLAKEGVTAKPVEVKQNGNEKARQFEVWFSRNAKKPKSE